MKYLHTAYAQRLSKIVGENDVLSVTPDSKPSWDGTDYTLGWTVSAQEPDGLHVSVHVPKDYTHMARAFILDAIKGARIARCPICHKVDRWENMYTVDAYPLTYHLHEWCTPLVVEDPQSIDDIVHKYPEPPGAWGWDRAGSFVGIHDVDMIREFLDAHGITYMTG